MRVKAKDLNPRPRVYSAHRNGWIEISGTSILDTNDLCAHPECNNIIGAYQRWSKNNRTKNGGYCSRDCYIISLKEKKE